jgi:hypothetical protein
MRATLYDNKYVCLSNITEGEEDVIWSEFSISDPNAYIDHSNLSMWDGVYRKYNRSKRRLARPLLKMLYDVCLRHNLPLEIVDERPKWAYQAASPESIGQDFLPGITLDDHQIRAIRRACKIDCGVINIPTGGGKCICFESNIFVEGLGDIQIGTLFDGFRDEECRPIDGLRVKYPGGMVDVTALYKTNKRRIIRLELESGHWLRGVPEHRVFTRRGWIMLRDLTAEDEVAING